MFCTGQFDKGVLPSSICTTLLLVYTHSSQTVQTISVLKPTPYPNRTRDTYTESRYRILPLLCTVFSSWNLRSRVKLKSRPLFVEKFRPFFFSRVCYKQTRRDNAWFSFNIQMYNCRIVQKQSNVCTSYSWYVKYELIKKKRFYRA